MSTDELRQRLVAIHADQHALVDTADEEKRDMTDDEQGKFDALSSEFDKCDREVDARLKLEAQEARLAEPVPRKTDPQPPTNGMTLGTGNAPVPAARGFEFNANDPVTVRDDGKLGFRAFGEFAQSVRVASIPGGAVDKRLLSQPTTYSSEGVGADGGFAIPIDFRATIMAEVMGEDSLITRTDQLSTSSNQIVVPKDETTPWQTTGGILAFWDGENSQLTESKMALEQKTIKLNKMTVLIPVTDELLEDGPALASYISKKAAEKMNFKMNLAIVQGSGAGQPLGILNSPDLVSIAKVTSQVANTIVGINVINMWASLYGPWRKNAVWLINQDVEPELLTLMKVGKIDTGAADTGWGAVLYMPAGGLSGAQYSTLFGRPIIPTQACETLGDKGDIILCDLSQYATATKVGGVRQDTSIHLHFDYDATTFRFIWRVAGESWWSNSISARDGSSSYSAFVTLDERA